MLLDVPAFLRWVDTDLPIEADLGLSPGLRWVETELLLLDLSAGLCWVETGVLLLDRSASLGGVGCAGKEAKEAKVAVGL